MVVKDPNDLIDLFFSMATAKIGEIVSPEINWVQPKITAVVVTDIYGNTYEKEFDIPLPTAKDIIPSLYSPSTTVLMMCSADLLVIDSQNRRVGAVYEDGAFIEIASEIPGAFYVGRQVRSNSLKIVYLPYSIGTYSIEVTGTGSDQFNMTVFTALDENSDGNVTSKVRMIGLDQVANYSLVVGPAGDVATIPTFPLPNLLVDSFSVGNQGCTVYAGDCRVDSVTPYFIPVQVTIKNVGASAASAFNVSFSAYWIDGNLVEDVFESCVSGLAAGGENITVTYNWHPIHTGYYNVTVFVDCHNEVAETIETGSTVVLSNFPVALIGDLNCDHVNDILDVVQVGLAWHSHAGDLNWNILADLNHDGYINILDIVRITLRWHQTW